MLFTLILACSEGGSVGAPTRGAGDVAQEANDPQQRPLLALARLEGRSGSSMTGTVLLAQANAGTTTPGTTTPGTNTPGTSPGATPGAQPGTTPGTQPGGTPGVTPGYGSPDQPLERGGIDGGVTPGTGQAGTPQPGMGQGGMGQGGTGGMDGMHPGMQQPGMMGKGQAPVQISIRLANAAPGNHAVFLHALGDCSAPDASSAGGWFTGGTSGTNSYGTNPGNPNAYPERPGSVSTPYGGEPGTMNPSTPGTTGSTVSPPPGYLGFVTVGAEGRGEKDLTTMAYTLGPGTNSIAGKAIVVYEKAPDFSVSGDPGARQACGVITPSAGSTLGTR